MGDPTGASGREAADFRVQCWVMLLKRWSPRALRPRSLAGGRPREELRPGVVSNLRQAGPRGNRITWDAGPASWVRLSTSVTEGLAAAEFCADEGKQIQVHPTSKSKQIQGMELRPVVVPYLRQAGPRGNRIAWDAGPASWVQR